LIYFEIFFYLLHNSDIVKTVTGSGEMGMAGESIKRIKDKEHEASELITQAHVDAKNLLEETRAQKASLIEEKDKLLQTEEVKIREAYAGETAGVVKAIEDEEKDTVKKLAAACEGNLGRVVDYIAGEIVKE
jgi:vacuolar-type H+-ATPase subunit H